MKDAMQRIIDFARSRTKREWQEYFALKVSLIRDFARAQGEKAALIAFVFGIFLVIFYKLVIVLACLGLVAYQLLLIVADSADRTK